MDRLKLIGLFPASMLCLAIDQSIKTFTARRYASAVYAMTLCLSVCVCVFVTSRYFTKIDRWIELVLGMGDSFDLSYTVL